MLGVGIYILVDPNLSDNQEALDTELFDIALYIMVASGGVAVFTAIMGIIGACCNSRCLLALVRIRELQVCVLGRLECSCLGGLNVHDREV